MRRYVPVTVPVFMGALRKANNMAMALEARGFGYSAHPTSYVHYEMRPMDVAMLIGIATLGIAYFLIYYSGYGAIAPR